MKVTIKSAIRSSYSQFECFQDQQIVFRVGNTLCIKQIGKAQSQFICLHKHLDRLLAFKPMTNRKGVFTAQKIGKDIQLAMYNLQSERKPVLLPLDATFTSQVQKIQLMIDDYDNYLLYGAAKTKESSCIFLVDFGKGKILAMGYLPLFDDMKVDAKENMTLSVCGNNGTYNYIKCLQYAGGKWEITEQILKRIPGQIIQHQLLIGGRKLLAGKSTLFVLQDNELNKTIEIDEPATIVEVVKIPKGFVVRLSNNELRLWADDSEQISFVKVGPLQVVLESGHSIQGIKLSNNSEELWLRTTKNDLFVWKCDNLDADMDSGQLHFNKVDFACSKQKQGTISLSAQKKYALLAGCNSVVLWSIQRSEVILATELTDAVDPSKRAVLSGAINPDGSSIVLAFEDKIKLYKILFTKFKLYAEFQIKKVQQIVYSHGGQLIACRYGRGQNSCIIVYNLLRLVQVCSFKVGAEPTQIFFNELDDELYVATDSKSVQMYRPSESIRIHNIKFEEDVRYARLDYKGKKLMVSTKNSIVMVEAGKIVDTIEPPVADFSYLFPLYGMYFVVGKTGMLYWSKDLRFDNIQECMLFNKKSFNLVCRSGNLVAYSSFQDIIAIKLSKQDKGRQRLGEDVVMIEKDQIFSLFQKVKEVESKYQMLVSTSIFKSEQEKQNYQKVIQQIKDNYQKEVKFANSNYQSITQGKLKQDKQNENMFQTLQRGQTQGLYEVQRMYQRKCKLQRQKVMNIEQDNLAQKLKYEELIFKLQKKYHQDVQNVRQQYSSQLRQESSKIQNLKDDHLKDKKKIEMQLIQIEEENQITIRDLQITKDAMIKKLHQDQKMAQELQQQGQIKLSEREEQIQKLLYKAKIRDSDLSRVETKLRQSQNRVHILQSQLLHKKSMIEQRDQTIKQQAHQISDLEKAKYVLSFRTTQIRKELEPKETMIDKLKSQLMKLDEQYKQIKKKNFNQEQKMQKLQTINKISKKQNSDLKIQLKYKQRMHDELCSDIFMVINTVDPKDWNNQFIKIYQNHIKEQHHKDRQKKIKDDTSQQINRHLIHVQQSLLQVTTGTDRIMKGKDKEVVRKMNQNSKLIYELNVMRKKQNQYLNEKKQLLNQNAKLNRQISQSGKTTLRTQTAKTGLTKRFVISRQLHSRDKHATLDVSDFSSSKNNTKELRKQRSRLTSARRTLMMQEQIKQKSGKFFDLAKELQSTKRQLQTSKKTILLQESQIEQLNQRIFTSE